MATTTSPMKSHEDSFKTKAQETMDAAKQCGDKAKDAVSNVVDRTKETASGAFEKAKDAASQVFDKTKETVSGFGQKAHEATQAVGRGIGSLAGSVRENLPQSGPIGAAASNVASGLESTGQYLEKENLEGMSKDVMNLIRRNPLPAMLVGIGLGYILARATGSRNS